MDICKSPFKIPLGVANHGQGNVTLLQVPLVAGSRWLSPVQAGAIYQEFSSVEEGKVTNIIEFDFLPFLEKGRLHSDIASSVYNRRACCGSITTQMLRACLPQTAGW